MGSASARTAFWEAIAAEPGMLLLDLGCGRGDLMEAIQRDMPEIALIGLEVDATRAMEACRRTGAPVVLADSGALPFRRDSFDRVLIARTLHHMGPSTRHLALREVARVLRPTGRLIILEKREPSGLIQQLGLRIHVALGKESREVFSLFGQGLRSELRRAGLAVCSEEEVERTRIVGAVRGGEGSRG